MRRATQRSEAEGRRHLCFNSRPSCDGRQCDLRDFKGLKVFQFTPVVRRATMFITNLLLWNIVSIHARRATGDLQTAVVKQVYCVSIHARRATGDSVALPRAWQRECFNSRPSCAGRRKASKAFTGRGVFQFTPVVRRATISLKQRPLQKMFQFTPVVRRATSNSR